VGNSSEDLKETMRSKTDEELYLLLRVHSQDYTLEAIGAAQEELSQRQKREPTSRREKMLSRTLTVEEMTLEERNGKQDEPDRKSISDLKETATGWGCLLLLGIIGYAIYGGYGGYGWLDSIGWISHREETVISARSDWLVGESKECWSATINSDGATLLKREIGYAMSSVSCDDGQEHKMTVTFYGRKVQSEYKVITWRCTRNEVSFLNDDSFTCYQTGGAQVYGNTGAAAK
jgi:hypothetical protein